MDHPLLLAVLALDTGAGLVWLAMMPAALSIVSSWQPAAATGRQLALERQAEQAFWHGRMAVVATWLASGLILAAIALILPPLVPGAMCGTGVLEATTAAPARTFLLRLAAATVAYIWIVIDGLNRRHPESPLTVSSARWLMLAGMAQWLSAAATWQLVLGLNVHQPVDCCAAVYDQFRSLDQARTAWGLSQSTWLAAAGLAGAAVLAPAGVLWRRPAACGRRLGSWLTAAAVCWCVAAAVSLIRHLAAYYYGVLHHHCPWCLMLPEHFGVGFLFLMLWLVVGWEAMAALAAGCVAAAVPGMAPAARARCRRAGHRVVMGAVFFMLLGGLPALVWRLRFGVWMG